MLLPRDLLLKRIRNELEQCRRAFPEHVFTVLNSDPDALPFNLSVTLVGVPGPVWDDAAKRVEDADRHRLLITITEDYPGQRPVVKWRTPIFHPNIMPPDEGGHVCMRPLDSWGVRSTLVSFLKSVEALLVLPRPEDPYPGDQCLRAAAHFRRHPYRPAGTSAAVEAPKPRLRILRADRGGERG